MANKYTLVVEYNTTERWANGFSNSVSLFMQLLKKRWGYCGQNMDGLHRSGRLPFSPEFKQHAAMNGRSDRGDKKDREGFLAMARMQSHPLSESWQGDREQQRTVGAWPRGTHLHPNLTHNVSVQLPLVCRWPALYLPIPYILLAICELQDRAGYSLLGAVPATARQVCLDWMQRAPGAG